MSILKKLNRYCPLIVVFCCVLRDVFTVYFTVFFNVYYTAKPVELTGQILIIRLIPSRAFVFFRFFDVDILKFCAIMKHKIKNHECEEQDKTS